MATEVPPMAEDFPRWYRKVNLPRNLGEKRDRLTRRWNGVWTSAQQLAIPDIESIISIAFQRNELADPSVRNRLRQWFRESDELFDASGNERELEVLAGCVLGQLSRQSGQVATFAALAITTAALGSVRRPCVDFDLVRIAEDNIYSTSEAERSRRSLKDSAPFTKGKAIDFSDAAMMCKTQPDFNGFAGAFELAARSATNSIAAIEDQLETALKASAKLLAIQDEELQMLWWLVGERSWDFGCSFSELPASAQPLIFGKELAEMTVQAPGPICVGSLLSRACKARKKQTLPEIVNACASEWLKTLAVPQAPSPITLPIHLAISRKLETGDDDSWTAGWSAAAKLDPDFLASPPHIGLLFYRERLLKTVQSNRPD